MVHRKYIYACSLITFLCALILLLSACGSSNPTKDALTKGRELANKIIPAPYGYQVDPTTGSSGVMTPTLFSQYAGATAASRSKFIAGFKQSYVDEATLEGLAITLIQFSSTADAEAYLYKSIPETLTPAYPLRHPYTAIPNATEIDGTKPYGEEFSRCVVFVHDRTYVQFLYANELAAPLPGEFVLWIKREYNLT